MEDPALPSLLQLVEEAARILAHELCMLSPAFYLCAPEIVMPFLHGWSRNRHNPNSNGWDGTPSVARDELRRYVYGSVESCLIKLENTVIAFPRSYPKAFLAGTVYGRFTSFDFREGCSCWRRLAEGVSVEELERRGYKPEDFDLKGNAYSKALNCLRQHRIGSYAPQDSPFWLFVQRAVKGFAGKFQPNTLGTGMLFDLLVADAEVGLRVGMVAQHRCSSCGRWTVYRYCPTCDPKQRRPFDLSRTRMRAQRGYIITTGTNGAFEPGEVFICRNPHSQLDRIALESWENHETSMWKMAKVCGNIYPARHCANGHCSASGQHDACPLSGCGVGHRTHKNGRPAATTIAFFFKHRIPVGDGSAPLQLALEDAVDMAKHRYLRLGWMLGVIDLIYGAFTGSSNPCWARMLLPGSQIDSTALRACLHHYPDTPSVDSLRKRVAEHERDLITTFDVAFSKQGLDLAECIDQLNRFL